LLFVGMFWVRVVLEREKRKMLDLHKVLCLVFQWSFERNWTLN
jgi:hypothetical protein